jgi:F0F1-type ATP synthase assembly protein I
MAQGPQSTLRLAGQLSTVGLSFVFALVLGFGGGYLLDGWIGTKPWFTFVGFFLGLAAGILNVYRVLGAVNAESREPGAGSREPAQRLSGNREPGAGNR